MEEGGSRRSRRSLGRPAGAVAGGGLLELLIVLGILGIAIGAGVQGYRRYAAAAALDGAADLVRSHLGLARMVAVARRETMRVRASPLGDLLLLDPRDSVVAVAPVGRGGPLALDSLRVRPATLRFNARGQAAPGSVYLYRGRRGVRLVSNFLGRVRRETFVVGGG
ncbi:MAG: GspH/FimT family pseudopilin [Gemmatimonadota bacterium]